MSTARRTKSARPGIYYREVGRKRRYEIAYRDSTGRQRWETVPGFDNLDAAEALRDERRGQKRRGELTPPAGVTFADVTGRYLASPSFLRLASTTRKSYGDVLADDGETMRRFGRTKVAAIDAAELARFIFDLERRTKLNRTEGTLRRSSVENIIKPVRAVFRQAVRDKLVAASPFYALDRDERPKPDAEPHEPHEWTDAELERLLAASRARGAAKDARYDYSPLLEVAARSGLRLGELLGLNWEACELVRGSGVIDVRQQWNLLRQVVPPKAGSRRRVPIADSLVQLLLELQVSSGRRTGPVFSSLTGGRLSHRNVQRRGFDLAAEDAGIVGASFHDLRHYYGSRLAARGLSSRAIADALGHRKVATSEIYISRINGDQADALVRRAMSS
jgi:integrase